MFQQEEVGNIPTIVGVALVCFVITGSTVAVEARIGNVGAGGDGQIVACNDVHVLALYLYVARRSADGDALEGIYGDSTAFKMLGFNVMKLNVDIPRNNGSIWLTEGALKGIGLDYSDENVVLSNSSYGICGIIRDYQKGNRTMEDCASSNMVWWNMEYKGEEDFIYLRSLLVKVSGDEDEAVAAIQKFYESRQKGNIYVNNLNNIYRQYFSSEENNLKLITIFALLVIMLSAMAMLAMSTYYRKQQARNWSVKKVLGCSRSEVFWSMTSGFIKVVCIAAVIAIPVGYIVIQKWLDGYSYRIDNYWWIYAVALMFIILVAVIAIIWQAVKLMNSDPIKELKKE